MLKELTRTRHHPSSTIGRMDQTSLPVVPFEVDVDLGFALFFLFLLCFFLLVTVMRCAQTVVDPYGSISTSTYQEEQITWDREVRNTTEKKENQDSSINATHYIHPLYVNQSSCGKTLPNQRILNFSFEKFIIIFFKSAMSLCVRQLCKQLLHTILNFKIRLLRGYSTLGLCRWSNAVFILKRALIRCRRRRIARKRRKK